MTELEKMQRAKMYLDKMAKGINPITDEQTPDEDSLNNVRVSRCLFYVSDILRQVIENGGAVGKREKPVKHSFSVTQEELSRFALSDAPIPVSEITKRINDLTADQPMKKLKYTSITSFLIESGFLLQTDAGDGRHIKLPTEQGEAIGISVEERQGRNGVYHVTLYNAEAQQFILDNIDAILEINDRPGAKTGGTAEPQIRPRPRVHDETPVEDGPKEVIRAVLLTSSGKNGAACVSGYDLSKKQFVRFVSDAATAAAIPFEEIRGLTAFDVVEVEALQRCPIGPQTENVHIKAFGLRRVGRYGGTIEDIRKEIRYPDRFSLAYREENRILSVSGCRHSLEIISVRDLVLRKTEKSKGGTTTRADFSYRGKEHTNYRVTDFSYDLREREESEIRIPCADLVLSIPKEEYIIDGYSLGYFKFIAAIFPTDPPAEERGYTPAPAARAGRD